MERRVAAEMQEMKTASLKMKELSVEKQRMVTKMEEESRVNVQMREIEAMRKDAIAYEKMRLKRVEEMRNAEESLIFTEPILTRKDGLNDDDKHQSNDNSSEKSGSGSLSSSSTVTLLKQSEDSNEYELSSDGNNNESHNIDNDDPTSSTDPSMKERLLQSPMGKKVVDIFKQYLEEEGDAYGNKQALEIEKKGVVSRQNEGAEGIMQVEGKDTFKEESILSPAIHAEARELIRKHIAQRGRNMSMITHAGSDTEE